MVKWLRILLENLDKMQLKPTVLHEDNVAFLVLAKGAGSFLISKHIGLRYHYLRGKLKLNQIVLEYIPTGDKFADSPTNSLEPKRLNIVMSQIVLELNN